jgi:phosphate transport system substrate-binding protein
MLLPIFLCSFVCAAASRAQTVESLSGIKRVYVGSLGEGRGAAAMRERLAQRLRTIRALQLVASVGDADAVLKGDGRIWTSGYQAVGAHPASASHVAVFDGFLSVELQNRSGVTLWSYLVSPSKYSVKRITSDLADQLVERLQYALAHPTPETRIAAAGADSGTAPGNAAVAIHGAGATFPWPLYQKWFESFAAKQPNTRISYEPTGSENGAKLLSEGSVDFAGSDKPLSDEQMSQWNFKVRHFASVMGAVVPIYNLQNVNRALNFTPEILAGIYLGRINRWNDPTIRAANPGAALPDASIVVVHRSDGSGTTFVWSDYLAKVSAEWRERTGAPNTTIRWSVGLGAAGSEGVATMVRERPNSIGYVELTYAIQNVLTYGAVRNAAGAFVRADLDSVTAAAADLSEPASADFRWSITNTTGKSAYPIATFTWLLLPTGEPSPKRKAEIEFLRWALTAGQKQAAGLGYAPLPASVANQELRVLDTLK